METKDIILEQSARLFAKKGYAGTSVREIASEVGIKDSSLYFHFESKQAIMDALKEKFIEASLTSVEFIRQGIQGITTMNDQIFMNVTMGYLKGYFMDPLINAFLRILMHEQSSNLELRRLYQEWCLRRPIFFQMQMVQRLQEMGFLKDGNPTYLAELYFAPLFLYFQEYLIFDDVEVENQTDQFIQRVQSHVVSYLKEFGVQ